MSRDANGTYSLPGGNPVITGTTISSSWANTTLSDVAAALTDSLSRSGLGGMTASLRLFAGTALAPGLAWSLETNSGLYRFGAGDFRWVVGSNEVYRMTSTLIELEDDVVFRVTSSGDLALATSIDIASSVPQLNFNDTNADANERIWSFSAQDGLFALSAISDAGVIQPVFTVVRSGGSVTALDFNNGTLTYGGLEIGYRGLPGRSATGADNVVASDNGRVVFLTGAGGYAFTIDTDLPINGVVMVMNVSAAACTIPESLSGSMSWLNGSGALTTGTRTLAVGGIASILRINSSDAYIWGTGLT